MGKIEATESSITTNHIENGILHVRVKDGAEIDIEGAKDGVEIRRKIQKGVPMLVLMDTRLVFQVTRQAREYTAKEEEDGLTIAMGIIAGTSLTATIIANFFIKFNKPPMPTKLFKTEEKALAWLETHR